MLHSFTNILFAHLMHLLVFLAYMLMVILMQHCYGLYIYRGKKLSPWTCCTCSNKWDISLHVSLSCLYFSLCHYDFNFPVLLCTQIVSTNFHTANLPSMPVSTRELALRTCTYPCQQVLVYDNHNCEKLILNF